MAGENERELSIGIVCHPAYGGSGVVASELGLSLAARGHQVHFFSHSLPFRVTGSPAGVHFHEVEASSYPVFKYPPYTLSLATKLAEVHRTRRLDIIHAHYAIPHSIAAYLCCRMLGPDHRPRTITTLHGTDITLLGIDSSFHEITCFALNRSDGLTAVSEFLARETVERFRPAREVRVIPNFIDSSVYSPERRSAERRLRLAPNGELLIGHLSNFRPVKRTCDVIRTFHRIHREIPARLVMMGTGGEEESTRHLAAELGVLDQVEYLGAVHDVAGVLAQLDLFLLPSEYESFGLAALEAMACAVPVISTRTGGVPEVVDDTHCGFLCEVGDHECMAAMAVKLLSNPERRARMARAARERAIDAFPLEETVGRYESFYREVIENPPRE